MPRSTREPGARGYECHWHRPTAYRHLALPSYQRYRFSEALCNIHHLRDLTWIEEELKQDWAKEMKAVLLDRKEAAQLAHARGQPELETTVLIGLLTRHD